MANFQISSEPIQKKVARNQSEVTQILTDMSELYQRLYPNSTVELKSTAVSLYDKNGNGGTIALAVDQGDNLEHWESKYVILIYGLDWNLTIPHSTRLPKELMENKPQTVRLFELYPYIEFKNKHYVGCMVKCIPASDYCAKALLITGNMLDDLGNAAFQSHTFFDQNVDLSVINRGFLKLRNHLGVYCYIPVNIHQHEYIKQNENQITESSAE